MCCEKGLDLEIIEIERTGARLNVGYRLSVENMVIEKKPI